MKLQNQVLVFQLGKEKIVGKKYLIKDQFKTINKNFEYMTFFIKFLIKKKGT